MYIGVLDMSTAFVLDLPPEFVNDAPSLGKSFYEVIVYSRALIQVELTPVSFSSSQTEVLKLAKNSLAVLPAAFTSPKLRKSLTSSI